jgi:hypothetical protein
MTQDEKNYIASRYHDYADCLPEHRQPEKAAAIKQLMEYFGIEELKQYRNTNHTFESDGISVSLTPLGEELYSHNKDDGETEDDE